MKFSINQSELLNALTIVAKGTSGRSTLPVLSGVYIETQANGLILQTTDLEKSIRYSVNALVEEEGRTVIPEKLLFDIVKNLPDAAVSIETHDGEVSVYCGKSSFTLRTLDAEDFPSFPQVDVTKRVAIPFNDFSNMIHDGEVSVYCGKSSFTLRTLDAEDFPSFPQVDVTKRVAIPFNDFSNMIKRVAKVVSKDQTRAVLTGVLISTTDEGIKMVATDSYRLAVAEVEVENVPDDFEVIVSGSFLQEVASLPKIDEIITMGITENQIVFYYQNMVLINRRIEGNFPNYRQLIPDTYVTKTCFTTQELITAVKRVSIINNMSSPVKFDINADTRNTVIDSVSQDVGMAQETLGCEVLGENMQIAFNHQYVIDGLSSITTDQVFLETQSSMKPGIFKAAEGQRFLYLVMPVRIA